MGMIENLREWLATEAPAEDREAIERRLSPTGGALAALNAVVVTGSQMRAVIEAIQHIPVRSDEDVFAHGRIIAAFVSEYGLVPQDYAAAALHARAVAMDWWCQHHDPHGQTDIDAFFEAGARCPLIETEQGMAFDPRTFADLVAFIAELPF